MRTVFASITGLLLIGCASTVPPLKTDVQKIQDTTQRSSATFPQGLNYAGKPSNDAPTISADFRAQENGAAEAKVVGGTKVKLGEFLDTVGVGSAVIGDVGCTGVLVEPDVVLSAAHCAEVGISAWVYIGRDRNNWRDKYKVAGVEHGLSTQHAPTNCIPGQLKCGLDIAVLLLETAVIGVGPRRIASDALVDRAISYRAVGFGNTDRDATVESRYKREARVTSVSNDCTGVVGGGIRKPDLPDEQVYDCEPGQEIVAGQMRDSTDTCNGDSGGPLLIGPEGSGFADLNDDFVLAGLTSRPTSQSRTMCGDGGVYERLNMNARIWIDDTIAGLRAHHGRQ